MLLLFQDNKSILFNSGENYIDLILISCYFYKVDKIKYIKSLVSLSEIFSEEALIKSAVKLMYLL